ncbi:MAG: hypothetical protein HZB70_00575 [Candidatus Berkelbacteria bacterium]|nr:MAG: hypothetical protein HZB70_00575 [Candidatus Berkelbacteria bacterium]QQG51398.1 MAG: hypothetical protein HY845_02425 [Candidatus Berkelbacteria bacterium]
MPTDTELARPSDSAKVLKIVRNTPGQKYLIGEVNNLFVAAAVRESDGQLLICQMPHEANNNLRGAPVLPAVRTDTPALNGAALLAAHLNDSFGLEAFPIQPIGHHIRTGQCRFHPEGPRDVFHTFWICVIEGDQDIRRLYGYQWANFCRPKDFRTLVHAGGVPTEGILDQIEFNNLGVSADRHPFDVLSNIAKYAESIHDGELLKSIL